LAHAESGEVAGYIWATLNTVPDNPFKFEQRVMYIHQIAVSPAHRKFGIGRALLEWVEKYANDWDIQIRRCLIRRHMDFFTGSDLQTIEEKCGRVYEHKRLMHEGLPIV